MLIESFAVRLKKAMELRNITQAELVEKTGITKGAISQYLKGEYEPKMINTAKIAWALDINQAWLVGESENMERYYGLQEGGGRVPKERILFMRSFNKLNELGREEALKRVEELTFIDKYINKKQDKKSKIQETHLMDFTLNAAHEIKGASDEDKQHDEDIMDDENF
jgi:transcriptional regulator with XRE-family HTH domain